MMEYKDWIAAVKQVIEEFSSEEFQERVWREGKGPEVSSYDEAMCRFFDDYATNDLIDVQWRQAGLTADQREKLAIFRDILKEFGKLVSEIPRPCEVLDHPGWPRVRKVARETLDELEKRE